MATKLGILTELARAEKPLKLSELAKILGTTMSSIATQTKLLRTSQPALVFKYQDGDYKNAYCITPDGKKWLDGERRGLGISDVMAAA